MFVLFLCYIYSENFFLAINIVNTNSFVWALLSAPQFYIDEGQSKKSILVE